MTLFAVAARSGTSEVIQRWSGPDAKGYPVPPAGVVVVPITEAKWAEVGRSKVPAWEVDVAQVGSDPATNDALVTQQADSRPILRWQYRLDGGAWTDFEAGVPLVVDDQVLEARTALVDDQGNVRTNVTATRRVPVDRRLLRIELTNGLSQTFAVPTGSDRAISINETKDYRLHDGHGPISILVYDAATL